MLNITTLATWLCVAGFGFVGMLVSGKQMEPVISHDPATQVEREDFTLGGDEIYAGVSQTPSNPTEDMPVPPEMPELATTKPLPDIPELPVRPAMPKSKPVTSHAPNIRPANSVRNAKRGGGSSESGMSPSSRLAGGRMSSPSYPSESKRKNQTGTVVVEFTIDSSGRVTSAHAATSSGWPLLDSEAIRTVRRWTFPAGGVMTFRRPIVFQLR